jgi:hypothetical protein
MRQRDLAENELRPSRQATGSLAENIVNGLSQDRQSGDCGESQENEYQSILDQILARFVMN